MFAIGVQEAPRLTPVHLWHTGRPSLRDHVVFKILCLPVILKENSRFNGKYENRVFMILLLCLLVVLT